MFGVLVVGVVAAVALAVVVVVEVVGVAVVVALVMVGVDEPLTRDFFDLDLEGLIEEGDDAAIVPSWFVAEKINKQIILK